MRDVTKDSLYKISRTLRDESDRAAAILGASLLEDQLTTLLEKFLVQDKDKGKMFNTYAPLSTLSAKTEMAYLLGLIPKDIRKDIDYVRKIRNLFAHKIEGVSFDKSPVSDLVSNLRAVQWFLDNVTLAGELASQTEMDRISKSPRRQFEIDVSIISLALDKYIGVIKPRKAKRNDQWQIDLSA